MLYFNKEELKDKIYGCWIGKNIGGTLGGPFEGQREVLDVKGYTTPPGEPLPNDDLDLQLVWLKALVERGPRGINAQVLGEYWINYITPPWGEYGICKMNLKAGYLPPLSGMVENASLNKSNGAWIRSEIWACISPGCPDLAIRYAYEDASVDHGGDEGMYAELFTAAMQSAAFVISDRDALIDIGLSKIPASSRVAKSILTAKKAYVSGKSWQEAREMVVAVSVPEIGWFQAPANLGFMVIGWLYGEGDFGKSLLIATNCGDDTDCTAATLGATFGIILGAKKLPREWVKPLGDRIITISIDIGSDHLFWPKTLSTLTEMTMNQVIPSLRAFNCPVEIGDGKTDFSLQPQIKFDDRKTGEEICSRSSFAVKVDCIHALITLDYCREPRLEQGVPFPVIVDIVNTLPDHRYYEIIWHLPESVQVTPSPRMSMSVWHTVVEGKQIARKAAKKHLPAEFKITATTLNEAFIRGTLEVRANGRHSVAYIPVLFSNAVKRVEV